MTNLMLQTVECTITKWAFVRPGNLRLIHGQCRFRHYGAIVSIFSTFSERLLTSFDSRIIGIEPTGLRIGNRRDESGKDIG